MSSTLHENPILRRAIKFFSIVAGIIIAGIFGYSMIEGWPIHEGLYMTAITISTVGFGETHDLSPIGRMFTTGLIFLSVITMACWTASLTSLFVEGDLSGSFKRKRTRKMIAKMKKHTIVCGSGIVAQAVVDGLVHGKVPVVVMDKNSDRLEQIKLKYPEISIIAADAVDEMSLCDANILMASNIVAALDSDFDNLMVSLTCKDLGTKINVIACTDDASLANRMGKIGVDQVVCPYLMTGKHIADTIAL